MQIAINQHLLDSLILMNILQSLVLFGVGIYLYVESKKDKELYDTIDDLERQIDLRDDMAVLFVNGVMKKNDYIKFVDDIKMRNNKEEN